MGRFKWWRKLRGGKWVQFTCGNHIYTKRIFNYNEIDVIDFGWGIMKFPDALYFKDVKYL